MPNDVWYQAFLSVSGQQNAAIEDMQRLLAGVIGDLAPHQGSTLTPVNVSQKSSTSGTSNSSGSTDSTLEKVLKSGLGVAPLIGGLIHLFSGDDTPAPLMKYALPPSLAFDVAESGRGFASTGHDQLGQARPDTAVGSGSA